MKLYFEIVKLLFNKYVRRRNTGVVIKEFCEKMGVVYIKFAQILATQNYGNLFTEEDRQLLSSICDDVNPISFEKIKKIIEREYNNSLNNIFSYIDIKPIGSASISQVHKGRLLDGREVAIKVKREDVTKTIESDLKRIKNIIHRFGKIVNFKNLLGGDKALDLYFSWIYEEIDFVNEKNNINLYDEFAKSVNGKIDKVKNICVPKVYEDLCTDNIIVMEFINHKTINNIELNNENKIVINNALNSYLASSFYALFNDKKIIFHGDPHSGNIYIDNEGNIGFLDMGLIFELSENVSKLTREFFLTIYSCNYDKLIQLLTRYAYLDEEEKNIFSNKVKEYVFAIRNKPVTSYFTDMVNICLEVNIVPPNFLFCMAKAFICLNGINSFSDNYTSAIELLQEQVIEYLIKRSMNDCKDILANGFSMFPKLINNTFKYGFSKGITKGGVEVLKLRDNLKNALEHCEEILDIINKPNF